MSATRIRFIIGMDDGELILQSAAAAGRLNSGGRGKSDAGWNPMQIKRLVVPL